MTTTTTHASPTTATTAVDQFLAAIADGRGGDVAHLYSPAALLDATVPGWRFTRRGGAAIAATYETWFGGTGRFEELDRRSVPGGEVVRYLLAWEERGVPHAVHHCHTFVLDTAGLIAEDRVFCGGRWDAALLAEMEAAEHAD